MLIYQLQSKELFVMAFVETIGN